MESAQEIQEIEQNPGQLSRLARNVGEWAVLLFDAIVFILAAIAEDDNRWES